MISDTLAELTDEMGPLHLDQTSFAAALGVTQAAVSQWVAGRRQPSGDLVDRIERAANAEAVPRAVIGKDSRVRDVEAPSRRWEPAFAPRGRFRLPIHIDWSGSETSRWRDASKPADLVSAYTLVIDEGSVADIVRWVDPQFVAEHWDDMYVRRDARQAWEQHLRSLGYFDKAAAHGAV